jgi:hypothetical protein
VSQAGAVALTRTAQATGLTTWAILHARLRHSATADEGRPTQVVRMAYLIRRSRAEHVSLDDMIVELANHAATHAELLRQYPNSDPLHVAKRIEERVMSQPDKADDGDN